MSGARIWAKRATDMSEPSCPATAEQPYSRTMSPRLLAVFAIAALLAIGCSGEEAANWRDDLIDLSSSEHARAMFYVEELDASTVDATMDQQCAAIDAALVNFGGDASVLSQLTVSIEIQRETGVPDELLRRDFAALDAGMSERCPEIHATLREYLPVNRFEDLLQCGPVALGDTASERAAACSD